MQVGEAGGATIPEGITDGETTVGDSEGGDSQGSAVSFRGMTSALANIAAAAAVATSSLVDLTGDDDDEVTVGGGRSAEEAEAPSTEVAGASLGSSLEEAMEIPSDGDSDGGFVDDECELARLKARFSKSLVAMERHVTELGQGGGERKRARAERVADAGIVSQVQRTVAGPSPLLQAGLVDGETAKHLRGMQAALTGWRPNRGQRAVLERYFRPGPKALCVFGGPGTGKSTVLLAVARGLVTIAEPPVVIAEYNHQVIKLDSELHGDGVILPVQTRAGLYQMPNEGRPKPSEMIASMKEAQTQRIQKWNHKLEDEFCLGAPRRLDACEEVDLQLRNRIWMNYIKFGDGFQGDPIVDVQDVEIIPGSSVAPRGTISMEGEWFTRSSNVEVLVLTETERFRGEGALIGCIWELSGGPRAVGKYCEQVRTIASAKEFNDDLYVPLGVGSNWQVMTKSNEKQRRRAARVGATEANGRMAVHRDVAALKKYEKKELKVVRSHGFEEAVYVIGERGLLAVKEQDPTAAAEPLKDGKAFITNMTAATVRRFGFDGAGKLTRIYVELENHRSGAPWVEVPLVKRRNWCKETGRYVTVEVFALKPYYERYIKLFQGLEFDEFDVDASHFLGEGLLLLALSRVRKLSGL